MDGTVLSKEARLLLAILREHLPSFIRKSFEIVSPGSIYMDNWTIHALAHALEKCRRREIKRLIILMPPRSLKSICVSVVFSAYLLGRDPTSRVITICYASDLTRKHSLDTRTLMKSELYQDLYPGTRIDPNKDTEMEFMTTKRGFRYSTSFGGTLTGRGGNFIIIDDPMSPADAKSPAKRKSTLEWLDVTVPSRLDNKTEDVMIVAMQRLHVDDVAAHLIAKGGWTVLEIPAIAEIDTDYEIGPGKVHTYKAGDLLHPEREPQSVLDDLKNSMGTQAFSAQYLQRPIPDEGNLVKEKWFQRYQNPPERQPGDKIVQSWDTASTAKELSNYSVCITALVRGEETYILDVYRERLEYPALKRQVGTLKAKHRPDAILIEDKSSGTSLTQDLRHEGIRPIPIRPDADKVTRMSVASAVIEAGYVYLPHQATWLDVFMNELLSFPEGAYDDQADALSQLLRWIGDNRGGGMQILHVRV
jgi:predicted phage terminase large subunit-like protein